MQTCSTSVNQKWPQKISGCISKLKLRVITLAAIMLLSFNVSAHVFEIRYNQAPNGSITWYLISYHDTGQCPAEQAGLNINGTNYPISSFVMGDARPLSPNILVQDLECCSRLNPNCPGVEGLYVSYGIVNTPFIAGALTIAPYSNAVCFAFCIGATVVFNPPPVINCPSNVSQNADNGVCDAYVTVPGPTIIDNCTYSGANPELVTNGNFSAGATAWNHCGNTVEAFCSELCYGGSNGANMVAEIDHSNPGEGLIPRTLCQNIGGFVPGKIYQLKFKASRRIGGPTPPTVGAIVKIDGGALNQTVLRSNTVWGLTDETFTFFATQATHQLTFVPSAGWSGSYGLIVDDISIKKVMGSITNNFNGTSDASDTYPVGTTNVFWTIIDCDGNSHTCSQTVQVIDNQPPVINVSNQFRCYEADNFGCSINLGATAADNCGILSLTSNAPACFPVGTTTVTWTATDVNGNTSTATQLVTRNPEIHIGICAGPTRTIYIGTVGGLGPFGPQSVNLTSTVSGGTPGYTYSWSPAAGLSDPNIANPVASPVSTTTYVLTVTDSKGCTRSLSIIISVLPLSSAVCSNNGNNIKFNVCHIPPGNPSNAHNICISVNALNAHLTTGSNGHNNCYLGPCSQNCFNTTPGAPLPSFTSNYPITDEPVTGAYPTEAAEEFSVNAYPNPSIGDFNIRVFSSSNEPVMVRILDNNGVVRSVTSMLSKNNSIRVGGNLTSGTYIAEVIQGTNRKLVKLIKLR